MRRFLDDICPTISVSSAFDMILVMLHGGCRSKDNENGLVPVDLCTEVFYAYISVHIEVPIGLVFFNVMSKSGGDRFFVSFCLPIRMRMVCCHWNSSHSSHDTDELSNELCSIYNQQSRRYIVWEHTIIQKHCSDHRAVV